MRYNRGLGFTIIEAMIVVFILGLLATVIIGTLSGVQSGNVTVGLNGMLETRCVNGYTVMIDQSGNARQMLDEFGKGVRCQ